MLNNLGIGLRRCSGWTTRSAVSSSRLPSTVRSATRRARRVRRTTSPPPTSGLRRFEQALDAAERSLVTQRQAGNRYGEGIALGNLGCACRELGRFADAVDLLQQALVIFRELRDQRAEARVARAILAAFTSPWTGSIEALGCLSDSLAIWRAIGDRRGQAATLRLLGHARRRQGRRRRRTRVAHRGLPHIRGTW